MWMFLTISTNRLISKLLIILRLSLIPLAQIAPVLLLLLPLLPILLLLLVQLISCSEGGRLVP